jgi:hypothetical protein
MPALSINLLEIPTRGGFVTVPTASKLTPAGDIDHVRPRS